MFAQILWFITWPVLIIVSYYLVKFALKKAGLL